MLVEAIIVYKQAACSVIVIIIRNGYGNLSSNPGWSYEFHFALMPLKKVWIQLFFLPLWVDSNLLSFLLRCATKPYEWGTQWELNSLVKVCKSSLLTITHHLGYLGYIVRQTELFNLGMTTNLWEGKLWIQICESLLKRFTLCHILFMCRVM